MTARLHRVVACCVALALLSGGCLDWDATWTAADGGTDRSSPDRALPPNDRSVKNPQADGAADLVADRSDTRPPSLSTVWAVQGGASSGATAWAVVTDTLGNTYLGGEFEGTITHGGTSHTAVNEGALVAKLDSGGNVKWLITGDGPGKDRVRGLALGPSGALYIVGTFSSASFSLGREKKTPKYFGGQDVLVAKIETGTGEVSWVSSGGAKGASDQGRAVAVNGKGSTLFVTGWSNNGATFFGRQTPKPGPAGDNVFVGALDTSSRLFRWVVAAGGPGSDTAEAMAIDSSDKLYLTGFFHDQVTFGGATFNIKGKQVFVTKFDPGTKKFVWAGHFASTGTSNEGLAVTVDAARSSLYVAGFFTGTMTIGGTSLVADGRADGFAARLNTDGNSVSWARQFGGADNDGAYALALHRSGDVWVGGRFAGPATLGGHTYRNACGVDALAMRLRAADGKAVSITTSTAPDATGWTSGQALAVGNTNLWMAGGMFKAATFGTKSLKSPGSADLFVWKLAAP